MVVRQVSLFLTTIRLTMVAASGRLHQNPLHLPTRSNRHGPLLFKQGYEPAGAGRSQRFFDRRAQPEGLAGAAGRVASLSISLAGLKPAAYRLEATSDSLSWTLDLFIVESGKKLTVSPNPARKEVDDSISVAVAMPGTGKAFGFTLAKFSGDPLYHIDQNGSSARLPLVGLDAGTYQVIVTNDDSTWSEDVDFLYQAAPYMTLSPNPASTTLTATINDPLYASFKAEWHVVDAATGNEMMQGVGDGPAFGIDVTAMPANRQLTLQGERWVYELPEALPGDAMIGLNN